MAKSQGTISESDSESVSKGSHHSITLMIDEPVTLVKKVGLESGKEINFWKKGPWKFLTCSSRHF